MKFETCRGRHLAALLLSVCFSGNAFAQTAGDPTDPKTWRTPEFEAQYGLHEIGADYAYAMGVDGSGIKIGVVDSGINADHPEFLGQIAGGYDFVENTSSLTDPRGHGSAVASIIAGKRDGVGMHGIAPGAQIVSARLLDADGAFYDDGPIISNAWSYLLDNNVRIINNSWGYSDIDGNVTLYSADDLLGFDPDLVAAAKSAVARDALVVFITHNAGMSQPNIQAGLPYLFPELERGWIAVTGYYYDGVANQCGVAKNWCLAAPAAEIRTVDANGGYMDEWGTSMAAPFVSGAAALVWQKFPYMTADQVRQVLLGTAIDVGDPGVDAVYGYGFLDAAGAVGGPGKFDWGDFNVTFDGVQSSWFNDIAGAGGLIKSGDGVLMMFGDSTYAGKTRIDGGILALAGSITSDTLVTSDGTLSGDGVIYGNVDNRGIIYGGWGGEGGTLTIDGDYHQSADASMRVKIGAAEGTSRVDVSGTAVLEGGKVDAFFNPVSPYRGDTRYVILSSGGLSGMFAPVVQEDYAFLDLTLGYDASNAYLNVLRNATAFSDVGATKNQKAVGEGAESLGGFALSSTGATDPSASIYDLIMGLNAQAARSVFDSFSGEIHSSVKSALIDESRSTRDVIWTRLRAASGSATPAMPVLAYGTDGVVPASVDGLSSSVWGQAYGSWGHLAGSGAAKTDRSSGGLFIGADGDVGTNWRAGFAGGYGSSSLDAKDRASSASVDSYTIAAYAGTEFDALSFRFGAAHTWHEVETDRLTALGASSADYSARTAQVFGEIGYAIKQDVAVLEPFANLAYVNLSTDGIRESGAAGLFSHDADDDNVSSTLGMRVRTDLPAGDKTNLTIRGMLGWQHAFGDTTPETAFNFSGGSAFDIEGAPIARDAAVIEAGLDFSMGKAITLGISYSGQMASDAQTHGFRGDMAWKF